MFRQPPTTPTTKNTTSNNSSSEPPEKVVELKPEVTPTIKALPDAMNEFLSEVFKAKLNNPKNGGEVEADLSVIHYYNPGAMMRGFEDAGYFVYDGVKVFQKGVPRKVELA